MYTHHVGVVGADFVTSCFFSSSISAIRTWKVGRSRRAQVHISSIDCNRNSSRTRLYNYLKSLYWKSIKLLQVSSLNLSTKNLDKLWFIRRSFVTLWGGICTEITWSIFSCPLTCWPTCSVCDSWTKSFCVASVEFKWERSEDSCCCSSFTCCW